MPGEPTLEERKQTALKHLEFEIQSDGERVAVLKFGRIACWYLAGLPGAPELRGKINSLNTPLKCGLPSNLLVLKEQSRR